LIDPIGALVLVEGRRGGRRFLRAWNRDAPVGSASGLEGAHDTKKKNVALDLVRVRVEID
jgi:hypothetical protein